jgi:hypothetical protein
MICSAEENTRITHFRAHCVDAEAVILIVNVTRTEVTAIPCACSKGWTAAPTRMTVSPIRRLTRFDGSAGGFAGAASGLTDCCGNGALDAFCRLSWESSA